MKILIFYWEEFVTKEQTEGLLGMLLGTLRASLLALSTPYYVYISHGNVF